MNTAQKAAVGIGLGAIALMGIFPPWNLTFDLHTESRGIHSTKPAGCAPIYQPPKPPEEDARSILYTVSIDVPRLLVQWAVAAAITGALVLILRSNTIDTHKNGPVVTGKNEPAQPSAQTRRSGHPAQSSASSAPAPERSRVQPPARMDAPYFGPTVYAPPRETISERIAPPASQKRAEPVASPAYPPIWSQAHTMPQVVIGPTPALKPGDWPWRRVARWMYNWRTLLAFIGGFSIPASLANWLALGERAGRVSDLSAATIFAIAVIHTGLVVATVYAYARLFTAPTVAGRTIMYAFLISAGLGLINILILGEYSRTHHAKSDTIAMLLGSIALACSLLMARLSKPLMRLQFAQLAQLLNDLHLHGVPHSFMPKYGGGRQRGRYVVKPNEPRELLSPLKICRQVITGKIILPDEEDDAWKEVGDAR